MGYTHFDKVDGVNGVYVGAKGSEVKVASSNGPLSAAGQLLPASVAVDVNVVNAATSATGVYTVAPIAGTVTGYAVFSVSSGTGRVVNCTIGSAGAVLLETAATGATGTAGKVVAMSNTSGTTTCAAGESLLVGLAACATAQVQVGCTLVFTPTAT